MIILDDIILSEELLEEHFHCDLEACKGACCVEGDIGAPLEEGEVKDIQKNLEGIIPHLEERSKKANRD